MSYIYIFRYILTQCTQYINLSCRNCFKQVLNIVILPVSDTGEMFTATSSFALTITGDIPALTLLFFASNDTEVKQPTSQ